MKTKKHSRTASMISQILSFRHWLDYDRIKAFTLYFTGGLQKMFVPQQEAIEDKEKSFSEEQANQNLSEQDLKNRSLGLYRLVILMLFLAVCIFSYALFQLFFGSFKAFFISLSVTAIALVLAFRYHFWYFQIKERKLGCTFSEWYQNGFFRR